MANISITSLKPTGAELFADSESYMQEFSNVDLFANKIRGGTGMIKPITVITDSPFCAIDF